MKSGKDLYLIASIFQLSSSLVYLRVGGSRVRSLSERKV